MTLEDLFGGDVPPYLTAAEIAKLLRIDGSTVRRRCEAGVYDRAFKDGSHWLVPSRFFERQLRQAEESGEFAT